MARPSKLNEQLIEQMCEKFRKGLSTKTTCDLLMITQPSFNNWLRVGEEDANNERDTIFTTFFLEIKKAKAEFEEKASERIIKGESGWQGTCWWLERTNKDYMPKQAIEANGEDGRVTVVLGGKVKQ
jgi:hypothetical protein